MAVEVLVKVLENGETDWLPKHMTDGASGADLRAAIESELVIKPLGRHLVPTGIAIAIPRGFEGQVRPRSGLAIKYGITLLNSPGTIDSDYRGEVKVIMANMGAEDFVLRRGERIAQLVIQRTERADFRLCEELDETDRGSGGFGHTGS